MKGLILYLFLTISYFVAKAQTDTAFWFAAPEVTYNNGSLHSDRPIYLRLTTLSKAATVTISEPANTGFTSKVVNIAAYSSATIDLTADIDKIETKPANLVLNYGIYIQSTSLITAYYEESSLNNPEMFVLKGMNALGTSFFVPTQTLMDNDITKTPASYSSFDIVATEDNTTITITPAKAIVGHAAGVSFTINLNKGQSYSAAAVDNLAAGHLSGSIVTSDKAIAITIKDDSIGGGGYYACLDLAGDQIVPISIIGTKYISIPGYLNNAPPPTPPTDWVFIVATQNNTTVNINGVLETTLNAGQTYKRGVMGTTLYIETSLPAYALHLSGFSCEVGHALLPTIECTGSTTVGFTRSMNIPLFMNILVPTGGETGFSFNGGSTVITASMFKPVPFTGGQWMYAQVPVSTSDLPAGSGAVITNSLQQFHLGVIHGDANGCRYGYFSDFNHFTQKVSSTAPNNTVCQNDLIQLICDVGNALFVNYQWTGPNGFTSNLKSPIINSATLSNAGKYYCSASKTNCTNLKDSLILNVNLLPNTKIVVNNPVCTGSSALFYSANAVAATSDVWIGPNKNIASLTSSYSKSITQLADSGLYILKESLLGCTKSDSVHLMVDTTPKAVLVASSTPCKFSYLALQASAANLGTSLQITGPNGFSSTKQLDTIFNYNDADTGKYTLTATLKSCSTSSSINTSILPIPVIRFNAISPVCENLQPFYINANETTGIAGMGLFSGNGLTNDTTGLFSPQNAGKGNSAIRYTYVATNGCTAYQQQTVAVGGAPFVTTTKSQTIFLGSSAILHTTITGTYNNIQWTPSVWLDADNIPSPTATPTANTTYIIHVSNSNGCNASDTAVIRVVLNIKIPNAFSPNGDGNHDIWEIKDLAGVTKVNAYIFDRNGQQVYNYAGNKIAWDGTYNGQPVPIGTYYYVVQVNDELRKQTFTGWIELLR